MAENKGLIFIPDMSGYTKFVNETEIEHSRLIIQELLEILINANQIGLEISEIEGDAILFYKFGESPELKDIYKQVERMFTGFHKGIISYDQRRYCQCKACKGVVDLSVKVVSHYGEFTGLNVRNFSKLIGKDIIIAHRLLKNDIEQHEYWLVTNNLLMNHTPGNYEKWMKWNSSTQMLEGGEVSYQYAQLSRLKDDIKPEPLPPLDLSHKRKVFSASKEYETDIITLFHAAGDFGYRPRWMEGVKAVEKANHYLPRIGMKCKCLFENGQSVIHSTSYSYDPDKIEFSETEEENKNTLYFKLDKINENKTRLTIDFYIEKSLNGDEEFDNSKKKKIEEDIKKSLENLTELTKELDFRYDVNATEESKQSHE